MKLRIVLEDKNNASNLGYHDGEYASVEEAKADGEAHLNDVPEGIAPRLLRVDNIDNLRVFHVHAPTSTTGDGCMAIEADSEEQALQFAREFLTLRHKPGTPVMIKADDPETIFGLKIGVLCAINAILLEGLRIEAAAGGPMPLLIPQTASVN